MSTELFDLYPNEYVVDLTFSDMRYIISPSHTENIHMKKFASGISAGLLISIGGSVYLSLCGENISKIFGAILFSVALLCICVKGYSLYTGRIGFLPFNHTKESISDLLLGLLGNLVATAAFGFMLSYSISSLQSGALVICEAKLTQPWWSALLRAFMCGVLMYLAVSIYKEHGSFLGIFLCIPVFILSGFEHSIANMFYFSVARIISIEACGYIWIVIAGNTLGAMFLPLINRSSKPKQN